MLATAMPSHAVVRVALESVQALELADALPVFPESIAALSSRGAVRNPTQAELATLEFYLTGQRESPSGFMALWPHFDFLYSADVLEIAHVNGSAFAIPRLFKEAQRQASVRGLVLTGNTNVANKPIARFIKRHIAGAEPDCVKWSAVPRG